MGQTLSNGDRVLAEIESRMGDCKLPNGNFPTPTSVVRYEELSCLRNFFASLKQGQSPLPHNVDEAAKEHTRYYIPFDQCDSRDIRNAFKAGAEWMAGQGETKQGVVTKDDFIQFADNTYIDLDPKLELTPAFSLKDAKEVVVQVRKK